MTHLIKTHCGVDWNLEFVKRCLKCGDILRTKPCDCEKCSSIRQSVADMKKAHPIGEANFEHF